MSTTVRVKCPLSPCTVDLIHEVTGTDHHEDGKVTVRLIATPEATEHIHSHAPKQDQP